MKPLAIAWTAAGILLGGIAAAIDASGVISLEVGYWSSVWVLAASMMGYRKMVQERLAAGTAAPTDERDVLDQLEDPYDLYGDDAPEQTTLEPASTEVEAVLKAEKKRRRSERQSAGALLRDSRAAVSIYRLGAYGMLVAGFFYLKAHALLEVTAYLVGLGVPVVVASATLMVRRGS